MLRFAYSSRISRAKAPPAEHATPTASSGTATTQIRERVSMHAAVTWFGANAEPQSAPSAVTGIRPIMRPKAATARPTQMKARLMVTSEQHSVMAERPTGGSSVRVRYVRAGEMRCSRICGCFRWSPGRVQKGYSWAIGEPPAKL